jgi:DNA-binding HxlR family transcriptional regulator
MAVAGDSSPHSGLALALASVGDRWSLMVVAVLLDGPRRFGDLRTELVGIAPNILSARLRHLEGEGLVLARPYSERPPRFVYELTAAGRELGGALRLLTEWGARRAGDVDTPVHSACGAPLESRWYCPTCERPVDEQESGELHFA